MKVLTANAMAAFERRVIEQIGVPGVVLMENAARGVIGELERRFAAARRVAILCGPGNNGGDGLAVARWLAGGRQRPRVLCVLAPRAAAGDAALQRNACVQLGVELMEWRPGEELPPALAFLLDGADVVVDALFGTGLARPLEGELAELVLAIDRVPVPKLAVDLPSGLDASSSAVPGPVLRAAVTVTFAAPKVAHVLSPADALCGELVVVPLGVPEQLLAQTEGSLYLSTPQALAGLVAPRDRAAHKGTFGHLLVIGGSSSMSGAAALATQAALYGGAGLVTAAVPEPVQPVVQAAVLEALTIGVAATATGVLAARALDELREAAATKQAVVLGPGLGRGGETMGVVRALASEVRSPLVLDADGLNAFAGDAAALAERAGETVLTPHPGELARLLEVDTGEIQSDRLRFVAWAARETGSVVVLKGQQTLTASPQGVVHLNRTGNPGLASGGTGDVLAGLVGALLAQGLSPLDAARLGVFVHGMAGDLAAATVGERALTAGAVAQALGPALYQLERRARRAEEEG